ncbi:MAG: LPP20 family lipoprotein [Bacillota bacterium]
MKKIMALILLFLLILILTAAVEAKSTASEQQTVIDWEQAVVKAEGVGWSQDEGSRTRLLAEIAAVDKAHLELIKKIKEVTVNSKTKIAKQKFESDVFTTKETGILKGAQIIQEESVEENGYRVVMEIKFYGKEGIVKAIYPQLKETAKQNKLAAPGSKFDSTNSNQESNQKNHEYTGVVINAVDLNLEPALAPKIHASNGKLVYALTQLNQQGIMQDGLVEYRTNLADAKTNPKAGDKPLVIDAQAVKGEYKTDLIISNQDAQIINQVGYHNNIFKERKVVIVTEL